MVSRHKLDALIRMESPAQPGYTLFSAQESLSGKTAQSANNFGLYQPQLGNKIRLTHLYFPGQWIAVSRWTALENVGNVNFLPG